MDINNSNQQVRGLGVVPNSGNAFNYDLKSEKEEIEKIISEVKAELLSKWKKSYANAQIFPAVVALMHPEVRDFLLNFNLVSVYDNIAKQANLDFGGRNVLPKIIWEIAQSEKWNDLDEILESHLQLTHSVHVQVANLLKQEILNKIQALSEKPVARKVVEQEIISKKVKLALTEAISKYPKLIEQNITSDQIKIRTMPDPVRPSIKNWIADFQDVMGAKKHSPIDRGNYLFHSDNTKKLTVSDRQKLGTILKSLDEETLLTVDVEAERIVFEFENMDVPRMNDGLVRNAPVAGLDSRFHGNDNGAQGLDSGSAVRNDNMVQEVGRQNATDNKQQAAVIAAPKTFVDPGRKQEVGRKPFVSVEPPLGVTPRSLVHQENPPLKHEEKVENFFQVPGSKPPIGSENFHAENVNVKPVDSDRIKEKPHPQNISYVQETAPLIVAAHGMDLENASDEELFEAMKQRKPMQKPSMNQDSSSRFRIGHADNAGGLNFSSPQQLPVEQKAQIAQSPAPQIASRISPQIPAQPERESFHISPRGNTAPNNVIGNNAEPRVNGNTVNLRQ